MKPVLTMYIDTFARNRMTYWEWVMLKKGGKLKNCVLDASLLIIQRNLQSFKKNLPEIFAFHFYILDIECHSYRES